ncbi:hypothetical protein F2P81_023236 [Scophthalmus maximus]|uniref:Uncharacterized protein n=1 Tax=Scophthalmus maximus TaxID=52904 RepID=A0A6A4S1Q7_SCOMX|nr:hypothetical protein F2P81_023236 [Scophthalmus maximus]
MNFTNKKLDEWSPMHQPLQHFLPPAETKEIVAATDRVLSFHISDSLALVLTAMCNPLLDVKATLKGNTNVSFCTTPPPPCTTKQARRRTEPAATLSHQLC